MKENMFERTLMGVFRKRPVVLYRDQLYYVVFRSNSRAALRRLSDNQGILLDSNGFADALVEVCSDIKNKTRCVTCYHRFICFTNKVLDV